MDSGKNSKVLTTLLCIELLNNLNLHQSSVRDKLRKEAIAYLECLLRELRRDLLDCDLDKAKKGFWRGYQMVRLPHWLHDCYVSVLQTKPGKRRGRKE